MTILMTILKYTFDYTQQAQPPQDVRRETIEEACIVALNVAEEISGLSELVNGFQHRGYATERQESEIYFEGFKDGRDMMRIDFSLPSGRFARRLREVLDNTPTV